MSLRPADAARALHSWRAEQLQAVERLLEQALRSWAFDWGLRECLVRVRCQPAGAHDDAAVDDVRLRGDGGRTAWLRTRWWPGAVAPELFGGAVGSGAIVAEVEGECIDDAIRRLADVLDMSAAAFEGTASVPRRRGAWSGEVRASLPFDGVLLLSACAVEACLGRGGMPARRCTSRPALASLPMPLLQAASRQRLALRAQLAPCEVDLGVLQDLQPGDVLRIPHRLDAPLQVRSESGATLFSGYLASSRGRKALELATAAEASLDERTT